ncbi:MAG: ricin-type beta-trefoil lectin domain protein [Stenotrophomonas sp.]
MKSKWIVAVAILSVSAGTAHAYGPRFANYPSTTTVTLSNPTPAVGETITVNAKVTAPALSVFYGVPVGGDDTGGSLEIFANGNSLGKMRLGRNNTPTVDRVQTLDQGCFAATGDRLRCTLYFYYAREAGLSVQYQATQGSDVTFTASFSGDDNFAARSSSAPVSLVSLPVFGLIRGMGGKCLDATSGGTGNGTPLQMYSCNENMQQLWAIGPGSNQVRGVPSGKVMEVADIGTANGKQVQLWDSLGGNHQAWVFTGAAITGVGGKVLDAIDGSAANGTKIQLWDSLRNPQQSWNFDPASGEIRGAGGQCLDVEGASTANGALVQLWQCSGAPQQRFQLGASGRIQGIGGKCLEIANGERSNGAVIRMWECNGQPHQSWSIVGEIRNVNSGRCLADPGRGSQQGARPHIWDCNFDENQRWTYSSY